jgi:hypothetical protein
MTSDKGLQQKMMKDSNEPNPDYLGGRSPYFLICGRHTLETRLWLTFDEMSIMNSMSNLFDVEIGNRSRDGCGATLG